MKIFFDLDGTLINAKQRLFILFQQLVPESFLSFQEYWDLKRDKIGHAEILMARFDYSTDDFFAFNTEWLAKIEADEFLELDEPFENVTDYLTSLRDRHDLYIVTARQFESKVQQQLYKFGWEDFFRGIFVTNAKISKYDLIRRNVDVSLNDWLVGDTGKDIETGKLLGIKTAGVSSGFLNERRLKEYSPDIIVNKILELQFK